MGKEGGKPELSKGGGKGGENSLSPTCNHPLLYLTHKKKGRARGGGRRNRKVNALTEGKKKRGEGRKHARGNPLPDPVIRKRREKKKKREPGGPEKKKKKFYPFFNQGEEKKGRA